MSVSLSGEVTRRIVLSATPDQVTEIILDEKIRTVSIQGYDAAGVTPTAAKMARTGTDGTGIDANFKTIDAGGLLEYPISGRARVRGGTSLFIASAVVSARVEVLTSFVPVS